MSKLKAVAPKVVIPTKPKFMVFGAPKVGKTYGLLDFPSVYYIDTEQGATRENYQDKLAASGGMYVGREQGSQDFDSVLEQVKALATEKHNFRTLVIDSFSYLYMTEIQKEADKLEREKKKNEFSADKKPAIKKTRQLLMWLDKLDMNAVLVCHEKAKWLDGEQVGITYDGYEKLDYMLELTLHIRKQGNSRIAFVKESRMVEFPMSTTFDWNYKEFSERYGKDIMEAAAKPVELATPEQIAEIEKLLESIKLSDSTKDKWIAENKENLADIETDKAASIINHLKSKVEGK